MDRRAQKLAHFGITVEDADALVAAGYDTPAKIKDDQAGADEVAESGLGRFAQE